MAQHVVPGLVRPRRTSAILIGDCNSGKTAILERFRGKGFLVHDAPSVGVDCHERQDPRCVMWDTSGQERYKAITRRYYATADVVLCAFDCTDRRSFEAVPDWIAEVRAHHPNAAVPIVLVATKVDLARKRVVGPDEASQTKGIVNYVETSARTGLGLEDLFASLPAHAPRGAHDDNVLLAPPQSSRSRCC